MKKTGRVSKFKLLTIQFELHNFKWAMIPDMKRKMHGAKRTNRKRFEQTTQTEVVREDFLEEGASHSEPET